MTYQPLFLIFIGMPGCGKKTLCEKIQSKTDVFVSETGELIRGSIKDVPGSLFLNDFHKQRIKEIQESGALQTSAIAIGEWAPHFFANYDGKQTAIYDGSPRRKAELIVLHEHATLFYDANVQFIEIVVTDEIALRRMEGRQENEFRSDCDTPEKRQKRLDEYHNLIVPSIKVAKEWYPDSYHIIDNRGTLDDYHKNIDAVLDKLPI